MDSDRRERFLAYFSGPPLNGDRQLLIKRSKLSKGRISQYFDATQPFGERAAQNLAVKLGLRKDAFLLPSASPAPSNQGLIVPTVAHLSSPPGKYSVPTKRVRVPVRMSTRPTPSGELILDDDTNGGTVDAVGASDAAYAVRIDGDHLYPALKHGMLIVCDPAANCIPGEWVVLTMKDGSRHLRELVFDRQNEVTTLGLLGGSRETISKSRLEGIIAVIGTTFQSRWRPD